ncbi:fimbria/pilus outer membrane usher protein [Chimaeribacter californicus]|nr:fimbria/pilus outer membrane usher protein [Chimaeribacter californicus]
MMNMPGMVRAAESAEHSAALPVAAEPGAIPPPGEEVISSEDEEVEFNNAFLSSQPIDVSRFAKGNPVPAGKHYVMVVLNERAMGKHEIAFQENPAEPLRAIPCLSVKQLIDMGIDTDKIAMTGENTGACTPLKTLIAGASWKMDMNEQRFLLNVPQALLKEMRPDEVPEALWDEGINAAFASYNMNYYRSSYNNNKSDSAWLGVDGGLNLLGWRLRVRGDVNYATENGTTFDSANLYVEHDVAALKSQLRIGEVYSSSAFFDAFPLRGVTLSSDTRMLPDSLNSFRPVIRGVAESNAKIIISQAGTKIHEVTVPPGEFAIEDYHPISSSDALDVTIQEADGRIRNMTVPFNGGGQLLYPGVSIYSLSVGEYNNSNGGNKPVIGQGTWQYGLNNYLSLYSGAEYMPDYYSMIAGVALNTRIGAVSLDLTHSSLSAEDGKHQGQSLGISYNSFVAATDTSVNISAYRYSTKEYYNLGEAVDYLAQNDWRDMDDRLKSRVQLNISQSLNEGWGSFYSSAMFSQYWRSGRNEESYQLGYSNSVGRVGYSVSVNRYYTEEGDKDDQIYLSLSIPLGDNSSESRPLFNYLNMNMTRGSDKNSNLSASASGYNEEADVYYGVNAGYSNGGQSDDRMESVGGNATWNTRYGSWGSNVSADTQDNRQISFSGNGGILIHGGGVTFGRTISNDAPVALIEAKGAEGAQATGDKSTRINEAGYAYVSTLSPYRFNDVGIDPSKMEKDTELKETMVKVVPRAGAITRVTFGTDERRSVFFRLKTQTGKNIPLGAEVFNEKGEPVGTVGQGNRAFTRGIEPSGKLSVKWGDAPQEQCQVEYTLPSLSEREIKQETLSLDNVICH